MLNMISIAFPLLASHGALHVALRVLLLHRFTLVVNLEATTQSNDALGLASIIEVELEGDQSQPLLCSLPANLANSRLCINSLRGRLAS